VRRIDGVLKQPRMRFQPVLSLTRADEQFRPQGAPPSFERGATARPHPPAPPGVNPRPVVPASIGLISNINKSSIKPPRDMPARFRPTSMSTSMSSRSSAAAPNPAPPRRGLPPPPSPVTSRVARPVISRATSSVLALAPISEMNALAQAPAPPPSVAHPPPGRSSRPSGGRPRATGDYLPRRLFGFSSVPGAGMSLPSQFERRQMLVQPQGSSSYGYSRSDMQFVVVEPGEICVVFVAHIHVSSTCLY
jgi:hypothetical protein